MVRDTALFPSEAIRLAALGILALGPRRYADLAAEVRHFASRIIGPSLDLMGSSLELLRYEGLVETDAHGPATSYTPPDAELRITEEGRREMLVLLASPLRGPINDLNKLIIALKMRFLHLLAPEERRLQIDMLIEICEAEIARLGDLRARHGAEESLLPAWIDHDLAQLRARLDWFRKLRDRV
jgi:DNA-binding PadR family transcriptional regulator